jgi:hypothetical protein
MSKTEEQNTSSEEQTQEQLELTMEEHLRKFKKSFKHHSKSTLISLLWNQGIRYNELQVAARQLLEENKTLKGETNAGISEEEEIKNDEAIETNS